MDERRGAEPGTAMPATALTSAVWKMNLALTADLHEN